MTVNNTRIDCEECAEYENCVLLRENRCKECEYLIIRETPEINEKLEAIRVMGRIHVLADADRVKNKKSDDKREPSEQDILEDMLEDDLHQLMIGGTVWHKSFELVKRLVYECPAVIVGQYKDLYAMRLASCHDRY